MTIILCGGLGGHEPERAFPVEFANFNARLSDIRRQIEEEQKRKMAIMQQILQAIDMHSKECDSKASVFPVSSSQQAEQSK